MQKFLKLTSGGCDSSSLGENDSNVYLFYDLSKQFPDHFMFQQLASNLFNIA